MFILFLLLSQLTLADSSTDKATTEVVTNNGASLVTAGVLKNNSMLDKVTDYLTSPQGILIVAGLGTINAGILQQAANDQITESGRNVEKINTLIGAYQDSWANNCPNGRENQNDPQCYCYTDTGAKNANRTNSQICSSFWATNDKKINLKASDYGNPNGAVLDPVGCLNTNGTFDETCKCKKIIDTKGNNACQKVGQITTTNPGVADFIKNSGMMGTLGQLNQLMQGNLGVGAINSKANAIALQKQLAMNQGLIGQAPANMAKNLSPSNEQLMKIQNSLFPKKSLDALVNSLGGSPLTNGPSKPEGELGKAVDAATAKNGLEITGTGKGTAKKKAEEKNDFNFNVASNQDQNQKVENFVDENKKYKYQNNDIVKDPSASLFDVISNRYIQSGMRRLFEEPK